jgi:pectin methylesterase-like acyl-CoA thioesterase
MSRTRFRKVLPLVSTLALILPLFLALAAPVSAATITVCASGCDYTTIQAAVDAANDGDVIDVYPGTYNESVDLNGMSPDGDITIRSVNSGGTPTTGTATVNGGAAGPAFETSSTFSGDVTIDGLIVNSTNDDGIYVRVNSDVVIRDVTANSTGDDGIYVGGASGNVTIKDCTANHNGDNGFDLGEIGKSLAAPPMTTAKRTSKSTE